MAKQQLAIPQRRNIFPRKDLLEIYDNRELFRKYRMYRDGILFVTDLIRDVKANPTSRNKTLFAEQKVTLTLRYLATNKIIEKKH